MFDLLIIRSQREIFEENVQTTQNGQLIKPLWAPLNRRMNQIYAPQLRDNLLFVDIPSRLLIISYCILYY